MNKNKKRWIFNIFFLILLSFFVVSGHACASSYTEELSEKIDNARKSIVDKITPENFITENLDGWRLNAQRWFAIGFRKNYLDKYNDYYLLARQFQNKALLEITEARPFLNKGKIQEAEKYLIESSKSQQIWFLYDEAAFDIWNKNIEEAQEIEHKAGALVLDSLKLPVEIVKLTSEEGTPENSAAKGVGMFIDLNKVALDYGFEGNNIKAAGGVSAVALDAI